MSSWEDNVRYVTPYVPGEQPRFADMIKLNTNENPYPPAPGVQKLLASYNADSLRLYPKADTKDLATALADRLGVSFENIFVGVGSDDVIGTAFLTFFKGKLPILFPDITYSFYPVWASLYDIPFEKQPVGEDFRIRKEDYYKPNGGVVIANPNAPTTIAESAEFIEDIVKHNPDSVVLVDEAYVDFGGESVVALTQKYENLLVTQTYSKSRSMAGMRIGYAVGSKKLISYMMAVRNSFNSYTMNSVAQDTAIESLKDEAYFRQHVDMIINTREKTKERLMSMGFSCPDSCTNFLFATHRSVPAEEIFTRLREKHIFVRYFKQPRIDNYLRITVGTDEEMEKLFEALKDIVA